MARELFCQAVLKFVLGLVLVNILIFFPAGTFYYWHAWLFIGILFIPMFFAGIVMMFKNPELLKKRLNAKEQQTEQDLVVKLSGLMFVLGFVIAGLNFRFKWSHYQRGFMAGNCYIFIFLFTLCRGVKRKYLLITNCRNSTRSKSNWYRIIWYCSSSYV